MEAEAVKKGRFERLRGRVRAMLSDDSDFEVREGGAPAERSRPLGDSEVFNISSDSESDLELQTFYFSMKLFRFMCERITKERIEQAGQRDSVIRKGVMLKRAERKERTDKLREYVEQQGAKKPSGSEHAAIKRKIAAQKKNTDHQMGRGSRDQRKRDQSACESEASCPEQSQSHPETSQVSQSQASQKKRPKKLWGTVQVPQSVIQGSFVDDVGNDDGKKLPDTQRAIRVACKEVLTEFTEMLDDFVKVDSSFTLPSTDYHTHGHILSTVVVHCTRVLTGSAFVRQVVDHRKQRFVLVCKLSEHLTGRKNDRKVGVHNKVKLTCSLTHTSASKRNGLSRAGAGNAETPEKTREHVVVRQRKTRNDQTHSQLQVRTSTFVFYAPKKLARTCEMPFP